MKNIKLATLAIICVIHSFSVQAQYTLTDTDVVVTDGVITDYTGSEFNIIIPNRLDGQVITSIGEDAFRGKSLVTVDCSNLTHLVTIELGAFYENSITTIDLSNLTNLTTIGANAFASNRLTTLDLSELTNLTTIGPSAFNTNDLTEVDLSGSINLQTIGDFAFMFNHITQIDLSRLTNLTTIGISAFRLNSIETVDFSDLTNLRTIGNFAFNENSLTSVDFSELTQLTTIGVGAFRENRLKTVDFTGLINLNAIGDNAFRQNSIAVLDLSELTNLTTIGNGAFYRNSLTTLDLSPLINLTSIGIGAFSNNSISALDFSGLKHLTTIGTSAFYVNSLAAVDLSDLTHLTTIGSNAFSNNTLTGFALPLAKGYVYEWKSSASELFSNGDTVNDLRIDYQAVLQSLTTYDITYHVDEGEDHVNPETYTAEDVVAFTAATKTGYNFEGWFTDIGFTTEITEITAGTTGDLALFAKFKIIDYTITYDADGGFHTNPATYIIEDALTFTAATKEGYSFEGWFTDENFTTEIMVVAAGTTGDLALFAKYSKIVLGLFDIDKFKLVLYPNPVTSSFSVDVAMDQIDVLNLDGQVVHTFRDNQIRYDVSHLTPGHYVVRLIKAGKPLGTKKIIINPSVR